MKIRIGDYGNIDFDEAIEMTNTQKNDFIEFMKTQFAVVEVTLPDTLEIKTVATLETTSVVCKIVQ